MSEKSKKDCTIESRKKTEEYKRVSPPVRIGGLFRTELSEKQEKNSELNLLEFKENRTELKSYPRRVLLELTNMCNYRCMMCGRNYSSFKPSYMDTDIIDNLTEIFTYAEEVTLFGWGEPTLHPEFSEIMTKLSRMKTLRKYILTNGSNLDFIKKLIKKNYINILAISLDGSTAEMNNQIRKGSDFNYIINKIKEITHLQKEGYKIPYMNLVFVMMRRNVHQLPDMVKLTKELGLPELKAVYLTSFHPEIDNETLWKKTNSYKEYFFQAEKIAEKLNIKLKLPHFIGEDPSKDLPHKECGAGWRDLFISSDGNIRPCQSTSLKLASIKDYSNGSFFELWNCENFRKFRETVHDKDSMDKNCKLCYQSSHANWNKKHSHIRREVLAIPKWE